MHGHKIAKCRMQVSKSSHTLVCFNQMIPSRSYCQLGSCTPSTYHTIPYYQVLYLADTLYIFSVLKSIHPDSSEADAANRISWISKSWKQMPSHDLLFPTNFDCQWGNDKQVKKQEKLVSQHTICRHIAMKKYHVTTTYRDDERFMATFLKNSSLSNLVFNSTKYTRRQLLPNYCSLLDLVTADSSRADTWCVSHNRAPAKELFKAFQKSKGLSLTLLDEVKVKELWIGRDPDDKVIEVTEWAERQWLKDQNVCPTGVISMDTESVCLFKEDQAKVYESAMAPGFVKTTA